jgi:hypothetical protein
MRPKPRRKLSPPKVYRRNVVMQATLSGRYYFCPKVEIRGGTLALVTGRKVDVTESVEALLKQQARALTRKPSPKRKARK